MIIKNETIVSNNNNSNNNNSLNNNNEYKSTNTSTQKVNTIEPLKDLTTSNSPIPQTGVNYIVFIVIGIVVVIGIYTFIRDKKFYD